MRVAFRTSAMEENECRKVFREGRYPLKSCTSSTRTPIPYYRKQHRTSQLLTACFDAAGCFSLDPENPKEVATFIKQGLEFRV